MFLPSPSDLLANLSNCREQVVNMLTGEIVRLYFILYCQPDCQIVFSITLSDWQQDYIQAAALQFYLADLPELFNGSQETENCLGAALQAAYKMVKLPLLCWWKSQFYKYYLLVLLVLPCHHLSPL